MALLAFWPEIMGAYVLLIWSLLSSFIIIVETGKQLRARNHFSVSNSCIDPAIDQDHSGLIGSLCGKFHDGRVKWKAVEHKKLFSVINALWPWPFNPGINRAHQWLMGSLCVKFHYNRCKRRAVMRQNISHNLAILVTNALWPWLWPQYERV